MGAAIIAGGDASPILELAEHVLDLVALAIEQRVMGDLDLAASGRRDTGLDALLGQRLEREDLAKVVLQQGALSRLLQGQAQGRQIAGRRSSRGSTCCSGRPGHRNRPVRLHR